MSKRTFALIFTLFIVAAILVVIAVYNPSSYDTSLTPATSPTPAEKPKILVQADLKFGTLSNFIIASTSGVKKSYSIPIIISANKNKITKVQLELSYDPQAIAHISIVPGSFFPKPVSLLNQIDEINGRISYAIEIEPNSSGIDGENIVATLTFQINSKFKGITTISSLPKTLVTAEGSNQSVLKEAIITQILIGENNATTSGNIDK